MIDYKNRVIPVWVIVYNNDVDQTYTFTSQEQAFASVIRGIDAYVNPDGTMDVDNMLSTVADKLSNGWMLKFIPIIVNDLTIIIYRVEMDRFTALHGILSDAIDVLDNVALPEVSELKHRIGNLFYESGSFRQ